MKIENRAQKEGDKREERKNLRKMKLRTSIDLGTMKLIQIRGCCLMVDDRFAWLGKRESRSTAESFGQSRKLLNYNWIERIETRRTQTERIYTRIERIEFRLTLIVALL
ncbi:hypothetical protein PanWU01x14_361340 [Parasponia andersonii]|uniref:Uncharacterized protein n=1 Tax=Parasponia andersonii TaxID=3476 RepID=A0A2P5A7C7_PARAD|nr:hypothetical protein PanWU01x14_361340 [Parasponia andersonii]